MRFNLTKAKPTNKIKNKFLYFDFTFFSAELYLAG